RRHHDGQAKPLHHYLLVTDLPCAATISGRSVGVNRSRANLERAARVLRPITIRAPAGEGRADELRQKVPETFEEKLAQLEELRFQAIHSASEDAVAKQHAK